jgi:heat shock protein HtpX
MTWFKRIGLFIVTNLLVVFTVTLVLHLLGVDQYAGRSARAGIDLRSLAIFSLVWGMAGSLISLAISRIVAKMVYGVKVIDPSTATGAEAQLVQTVHGLARAAGLPRMPEVGVYDSPEVNAFATGPTKSRALVAVSSGLLRRMDRFGVEGVLGHEIAHVANGDMVTMTLLQGIINAFVLFASRLIAAVIFRGDKEDSYMKRMLVTMGLQLALGLLGSMVVAAFSRWREYRADSGGARLAGRDNMITALEQLRRTVELPAVTEAPEGLAAFKISGKASRFTRLFSTHPPLEERIARLERA